MTLTPGTRLGPYEIQSALGAGGMGEVYRARDTKLGRDVAIKVVAGGFSHEPERVARFHREAQLLAALNHPNIATIHGLEEANGTQFLIMELVEGETLAERLKTGPMPLRDALSIARQVADALQAAHEKGIIHRDLKPANIALTGEQQVKVLDFGLAKALEPDGGATSRDSSVVTHSPTLSLAATQAGVILGTAAYMAPEQARGRPADRRSDVWAFGCVLFEMLTGKRAFEGEDPSETLAFVMAREPDWNLLPADVPPVIRTVLRRCLEKDRKERLPDIGAARLEIKDTLSQPQSYATRPLPPAAGRRERLAWAIAAASIVIAAAFGITFYRAGASPTPPELRLHVTPPGRIDAFAMSPDGQQVVLSTAGQLWLRPLGSETTRLLEGTEGGAEPFWSPDSRSIGFIADCSLKRVDVDGGSVQTLANVPLTAGGAWGADGTILFSGGGLLYRLPPGGEKPVLAAPIERPQQTAHLFPSFLPDGRRFLFFATGTPEGRGVYVASLDGTDTRRILDVESAAVFAPPNHLLFARQRTLMAQQVDLDDMEPVGEPFLVAERVTMDNLNPGQVALSSSVTGSVAYIAEDLGSEWEMLWFDRSGKQTGTVGRPEAGEVVQPRLSPDDRTVAVSRTVNGNRDIWLIDAARGLFDRFTSDAAREGQPLWSPDGNRLIFFSDRSGVYDLHQKAIGSNSEALLLASVNNKNPYDWSRDGRFVVYADQNPTSRRDLWVLPLDGDRKPFAFAQTDFEESDARFSPDGRWIAYASNETGRNEIYVQPFPGPGGKVRISTGGGTNPQWRNDGRELFYRAAAQLMAVPITFTGQRLEAGVPAVLFSLAQRAINSTAAAAYTTSDGQRFLITTPTDTSIAPLTVILNWHPQTD